MTIDIARKLLADGHEFKAVFSFACDNIFNFNHQTRQFAEEVGAEFAERAITEDDIERLTNEGCEGFLSAGYPFKIPPIDFSRAYGINVHPSFLPKGRGLMPTPYIIMGESEAAGITFHKIAENFDQGDILLQRPLSLHDDESVETYSARLGMMAPEMASVLIGNIKEMWKEAEPQDEDDSSYFPAPDDKTRMLNWGDPLEDIDKKSRAFGRYGSLAQFDDQLWVVYNLSTWEEEHTHEPGTVICRLHNAYVIAVQDGYVCLKEFYAVQQ